MGKSQDLYVKAKKMIPGGTQLLSKRPEMFLPDHWPAYYQKAKGCEVWDLDGNKYIDMVTMGIGACILGFAEEDVNKAVKNAIDNGNMATLNAPEEVELAELLIKLHPWAGMVRYVRSGGEAMSVAIRVARAHTRKDKVLFCGYHGWHDWYLSANLADDKTLDGHLLPGLDPAGVPRALKGLTLPFNYNNTEEFVQLFEANKNELGAVVLEAVRNYNPDPHFVSMIRKLTKETGIPFIVDEITSGWRLNVGGAHLLYNLQPDIAVYAKAMSNGYPMGAIVGREEVMQSAQESFISSTYWTERIGPVAAITTIRKLQEKNVPVHLSKVGRQIQEGWKALAEKNGLKIEITGIYPLGHFAFQDVQNPLIPKTLFTQFMLEKGFLATTAFYASYAHKEAHIKSYLDATDQAFAFIAKAIKEGNPEKKLRGPVCHAGFKRLN